MGAEPKHPMQPLERDARGVVRFRANGAVRYLLDAATAGRRCDLNDLARALASGAFTADDHAQLAQLIGYSVSGFGELSYVSNRTYARARRRVETLRRKDGG